MLYTEGISYLLEGDPARSEAILARALDLATDSGSLPLAGLILAEQCGVAAERNDWPEVTTLAQRAAAIVEDGRFGDYWTSALVYAWASRAAAYEGDALQTRFYLGRASRLRPLLTYALPVVSVQALLEMTRSYITLGDSGGAAAVLAQARFIIRQRPDLGFLPALADRLRVTLATTSARAVGASSLTAAELRLMPLLSTHLSYQEMGERLHVSKNTVKTQAYSAYRKLGVSTRSDAVIRARELGLDGL
jgi:LuxR family transcriptional regulator, maltose regulon positive regulatory protein